MRKSTILSIRKYFLVATFLVVSINLHVQQKPSLEIHGVLPWHNFLSGPTAWIFQNEYQIIPTEGACFFSVDTNVSVQSSEGHITASYEIVHTEAADKIIERKTLVPEIPTINNVVYDFKDETNLSEIRDEDILATEFTDEVSVSSGSYPVF